MNAPKGYNPQIKISDNFSHLTVEEKRASAKQIRDMWETARELILKSL